MEGRLARFHSFFGTGFFPNLTDDVIDCIEDFLLYGPDAMVNQYMGMMVELFVMNLTRYLHSDGPLPQPDSHYQRRLLRALRFFRPRSLTRDFSETLESLAFQYLEEAQVTQQRQIFVFLVDHFITLPDGISDRIGNLIKWTISYLAAVSQAEAIDTQLLTTVVYSFTPLLEIPGTGVKSRAVELISVMLRLCSSLLRKQDNPGFSFQYAPILAKYVRLASRIIFTYQINSPEVYQSAVSMQSLMTFDVRYSQIFENYLVLACTIVDAGNPQYSQGELAKFAILQIISRFIIFIHNPFVKSKRTEIYLRTVANWLKQPHQQTNNVRSLVTKLWPLLGNVHFRKPSLIAAYDIFQNTVLNGQFRTQLPSFPAEFLDQLVGVLEVLRMDLETLDYSRLNSRPFEARLFLKSNVRTMRLILGIIEMHTPEMGAFLLPSILPLVRLTKYISWLMDVAGYVLTGPASPECPVASVILYQLQVKAFRQKI
jgi:hypothetical protein